LIEAAEADEFIRAAVLAVLTTLTATGRIAREETEAYVLEAVSGAVRQAFGRGLTDPMVMGDIRTDLGRTLANPELSGWSTVITQGVGRRGWREAERSARAPPLRGTLKADSLASWDAPISNA
jgi:hypothetical protein